MTRAAQSGPASGDSGPGVAPAGKSPPPGLSMRAPRPPATRLRKSVVQVLVLGGVVVVSGSLAWAFVVQPELRDSARARAEQAREDNNQGVVRPAGTVTDQPASYDRLPPPRTADADKIDAERAPAEPAGPTTGRTAPVAYRSVERGPRPAELAARSGLFFEGETAAATGGRPPQARPAAGAGGVSADVGAMYNGHTLTAPLSPYELKAGAVIPATLLNAVDTARAGPVVAAVTRDVFDTVSGRHLVLPQGTRLIGRHEGESAHGDRRAFLVWDRLILPNGKSLLLSGEPGVDAQGAVGVRGHVDRRLLPLLTGTLFAGAITTLGELARDGNGRDRGGAVASVGDAAAIEGAQVGGRLIDRELQVRPSIRLRPGAAVGVMITRDLVLEPYRP